MTTILAESDQHERFEESKESKARRLNPLLLQASVHNDSPQIIHLLDQNADPLCEDHKGWSALTWAACHGDVEVSRKLLSLGASNAFADLSRQKHTPMHWACFKGNLKVVWLLLRSGLSVSGCDQGGNSCLHQAAAGGNAEVVSCLLGQGVDPFAKNDRGHLSLVLCTNPASRVLLIQAMEVKVCKSTGKQFSSTVPRFYCPFSSGFYCEAAVVRKFIFESAESDFPEKPITMCLEIQTKVSQIEESILKAITSKDIGAVTKSIELARSSSLPIDLKLLKQARILEEKLGAEILLASAQKATKLQSLDDYVLVLKKLSHAIDVASEGSRVTGEEILKARNFFMALKHEYSLFVNLKIPAKSQTARLKILTDLVAEISKSPEIKSLVSNEVFSEGEKTITFLVLQRDCFNLLDKYKTACDVASLRDLPVPPATVTEPVPLDQAIPTITQTTPSLPKPFSLPLDFLQSDELLTKSIEEYAGILRVAEEAKVGADLIQKCKSQVDKLEILLGERKVIDEEVKQKSLKKSKKTKSTKP